jgi:hypothetical protein
LKNKANFRSIRTHLWAVPCAFSFVLSHEVIAEDLPELKLFNLDVINQTYINGKLEFKLLSDVQSDPLPVKYLGHSNWTRFLDARPGINMIRIDKSAGVELTSQDRLFSFGLTTRIVGRLLASEESLRNLRVVANREAQPRDWLVDVQLNMEGFSGTGVQWQQKYNISPQLHWRFGGQGLLLNNLQSRDFSGQMGYQQLQQSYRFEVVSQDKNNALRLPYQDAVNKFGQGLLFNTHIAWQSKHAGVEFGVKDLGILHWQGLPNQVLKLNSNITERDSNGYLLYRPLLTGQNSQVSVLQKSPWVAELTPKWIPTLGQYFSMPWQYIPNFGWLKAYRWTNTQGSTPWAIEWRDHDRNLVFHGQWSQWVADIGFSNFSSNSRSQIFKLSYVQKF